ncbi:hypothetical protein E4T73_07610 [Staphylococcus arlettae]|uniref:hypothetical protein n=1 Tax=Staphylococcus arlettae TaxID=29378 RepID=UPI0010718F37|nr:hypothetical protein [Staphylococcus arlettae]MBF0738026.1 hypothetical protein [Staphylococcus arlettae]TFU46839.1 hypothetical protein E4T73_07610 [Staphylococcus arlettae]
MAKDTHHFKNFEHTLTTAPMQRGAQYAEKKKKSWVSLIIHIIILILLAITGYSMYNDPIVNLVLADEQITFSQITHFQDTINNISNLNINIDNIENLHSIIDTLIFIFYIFFIAIILSLIFTIFILIFNRTVLKIINLFIMIIMLVITFGFSIIIKNIASRIANSMSQYYITVKPSNVLIEADAIHNALILLSCAVALGIISLFFRNRRTRIS